MECFHALAGESCASGPPRPAPSAADPDPYAPRVPRHRIAALALLAGVAAACTDPVPVDTDPIASTDDVPAWLLPLPDGVAVETVVALAGMPPCETVVETVAEPGDVTGLRLPPGAEITEVSEDPPLVTVRGLLAATPVQTRVWLESRDGLEILHSEDEIREAELLVGDGAHRMFLKAQAICDQGSIFQAVIAPELAGDDLPSPGATTP